MSGLMYDGARKNRQVTATRSLGLPFNGFDPRNLCNYMDYYSFTDHGGTGG